MSKAWGTCGKRGRERGGPNEGFIFRLVGLVGI